MRPTLDKRCRPFKHGMAPTLVRASPMLALTGWTGRQALIGRIWGTDREQHGGHGLLGSWEVDAAWKGKEQYKKNPKTKKKKKGPTKEVWALGRWVAAWLGAFAVFCCAPDDADADTMVMIILLLLLMGVCPAMG